MTSNSSTTTAKTSLTKLSPLKKQHASVALQSGFKRLQAAENAKSQSTGNRSQVVSLRRDHVNTVLDEYYEEVLSHMTRMERETLAGVDLMDAQPELRWYMRPYLVDFIIEIHQTFRLRPETLFLTMNIVDRYASKRIVYKRHYQLVGCAALLIASKFEDSKDKVPLGPELVQMCCSAYDESAFIQMEGHVLSTIGWTLGFPTPEAFLRLNCATSSAAEDKSVKTQSVARFLMEMTLFTRDFVGCLPSSLASACLLIARYIVSDGMDKSIASSGVAKEVKSIAETINQYLLSHSDELSEILVKKYSFSHFSFASTLTVQFYANLRNTQSAALPTLLPAHSLSATTRSSMQSATDGIPASSFNTPRRSTEQLHDEHDDDNMSMPSPTSTPSSMVSTPSHISVDVDSHYREDDDDDEYDEESDMPVTPMSLNSLHDPLVAAEHKENAVGAAVAVTTSSQKNRPFKGESKYLHVQDNRSVLSLSQQENRMVT